MRVDRRSWLVALALLYPAPAGAQPTDCSTSGQNQYVRAVLREYYYWYQQLPDPDPALPGAARRRTRGGALPALDETFSYISPECHQRDATLLGQPVHRLRPVRKQAGRRPGDVRIVTQAFPDSAATAAGLARGAAHPSRSDGQERRADLRAAERLPDVCVRPVDGRRRDRGMRVRSPGRREP